MGMLSMNVDVFVRRWIAQTDIEDEVSQKNYTDEVLASAGLRPTSGTVWTILVFWHAFLFLQKIAYVESECSVQVMGIIFNFVDRVRTA